MKKALSKAELLKTLTVLKSRKKLARFYLDSGEKESFTDGFVLEYSKDFVLLREFIDFMPRSLVILPCSKILSLRQGKTETTFTRILKAEKGLEPYLVYEKVPLSDFASIFKFIKKRYTYVILEDLMDGTSNFCIGEIARVNAGSVAVYYFDVTGKVDLESLKVPYKDIFRIEYESHYLNTFSRHLRYPRPAIKTK